MRNDEIELFNGCSKCPSHRTCPDAYQLHSEGCNHYGRTEEEFQSFIIERLIKQSAASIPIIDQVSKLRKEYPNACIILTDDSLTMVVPREDRRL